MEHLTFRLQVVTPLFLSGADQGIAELRPPSIRGALRFWFRAIAGAVLKYDWQAVKQAEALVFGSTDRASLWLLRVRSLTCATPGVSSFAAPLAYLGYGPIGYEKRSKAYVAQRDYYPPNSSCQIEVYLRCSDPLLLQLLGATFWVWGHLGGLGSRVRRGFGGISLKLESSNGLSVWPRAQVLDQNDVEKLVQELQKGLEEACLIFARLPRWLKENCPNLKPRPRPTPEFFVLDRQFVELYVGQKIFNDWKEALETIGEALIQFRHERSPDHDLVLQFVAPPATSSSHPQGTLEKVRFGLPLNFYFRDLEAKASVTAIRELERNGRKVKEEFDRRASPLMIRVLPLQGNACCVGLIRSKAEFLPSGSELILSKGRKPQDQQRFSVPLEDVLDIFLKDLFRISGSPVYGRLGQAMQVPLPDMCSLANKG